MILSIAFAQIMLIPLRDANLEAVIAPEKGAEMASLKVNFRGRWVETLWRALDYDPKPGWTGKAPFLWPATGRNFPKDIQPDEEARGSSYDWNGKRYPMPIHGFARDLPWKVERRSGGEAVLSLADSAETRKYYPWSFRLTVSYRVRDGKLTITYDVEAARDNRGPMPFSAGNHITFRTPLVEGGDAGAMEFETPSTVEYLKAAGGVPTGEKRAKSWAKPIRLADFPAGQAVSLGGYSGDPYARLKDAAGLELAMRHSAASIPAEPVLRFNVWGDPKAGYFSPEPWVGLQNSFNLRQGLVYLNPGDRWWWRIEIEARDQR